MEQPLVSILIPTWNRAYCIKKAIESAINQSWDNIEIIIVDNDSSDNTQETIEEMKRQDDRIIFSKNSQNIGAVNNWKRCFELSSGDYIKILWSDDWLEENTIEELIQPMLKNKEIGFTLCKAQLYNKEMKLIKVMHNNFNIINKSTFVLGFSLRKPHLPYSPMTALIKRKYVENTFNGYDLSELCVKKAIGTDLLMIYNALIDEKTFGLFVVGTHVNFYESEDSITETSDKFLLNSCYEKAVQQILFNFANYKPIYSILRLLRMYIDKNSMLTHEDVHILKKNLSIKGIFSKATFLTIKSFLGK